jgi:hypothetical protein
LHVERHIDRAHRRIGTREWRIEEQHQAVAHEAGQCRFVAHDDRAKGLVIFAKQPHDFVRPDLARKGGEAAKVTEHDGDLGAATIEKAVSPGPLDEFGHLRCEEALEAHD